MNLFGKLCSGLYRLPLVGRALLTLAIRKQAARGARQGFLPTQLAIETSNTCNARCIMCPYLKMTRRKGIMSDEMHRHIIEKIVAWGPPIRDISHAGLGEPLTDAGLFEKILREKSAFPSAAVTVYSNGGLLSERAAESLFDARLDGISFSLNAYRKQTYEKVTKLAYEKTFENISRFLEMNRSRGNPVRVQVSLIPTPEHSAAEIDEFTIYWKSRVDQVIIPPWIGWGNFFEQREKCEQWPCKYIWSVLQIDWDGTLRLCCEDFDAKYPLGNLLEDDPATLFNSPVMRLQRRAQLRGDFSCPPICRDCVETHGVARDFWLNGLLVPEKERTR